MDHFGDELEISGAFRSARSISLRKMYLSYPDSIPEFQRCEGKRFADRMIGDAVVMFGPIGKKVPLHFPLNIKAIECFAVDTRYSNNPLAWRYAFEVLQQGNKQGKELVSDQAQEFVTSFSGFELSRIFSSYDQNSPHYRTMALSVEAIGTITNTKVRQSQMVIDKLARSSRSCKPG